MISPAIRGIVYSILSQFIGSSRRLEIKIFHSSAILSHLRSQLKRYIPVYAYHDKTSSIWFSGLSYIVHYFGIPAFFCTGICSSLFVYGFKQNGFFRVCHI